MNQAVERWDVSKKAVCSERGVVAAQHHLAAAAGADMLARGGNAVDAAVACAFALGCVEPWMCGLGGSGYLVVWNAAEKTSHMIDFQGMLPNAIDPSDYPIDPAVPETIMGFPGVVDRRNIVGSMSVTVPGAVKGLSTGLERFGRLGLDTVLQPSITLAEQGLPVDWFTTLQIAMAMPELKRDLEAAQTYLPGGSPAAPEQFIQLGKLEQTLRRIAEQGPDDFYFGRLAEEICLDLKAGGSRIDQDDFETYQIIEEEALVGHHRGVDLHLAGSTSGGLRLLDTLSYIEEHLQTASQPNAHSWKIYADGLNHAWQRHKTRIGRTTEVGGCTSHMSAVDSDGNMAALTYTLLSRFGSGVMLPSTGMLMNNSVSYFDMRPGYPTTMEPRKRINASNMCPTIATRDGEAMFAVGASGANFIQPCTTQIAALMLDFDMGLEEAFNHPRIDASDRRSIRVDPRLGTDVIAALDQDFELEIAQRLVFPKLYSCPSGVSRDAKTGVCYGISDPSQPIGDAVACAPMKLEPERKASVDPRP